MGKVSEGDAVTLRYRFLTNTKEWVVVGPAGELRLGPVVVTKMDGDVKPETITRLSKPYSVDGIDFRFGYMRKLPKGTGKVSGAPLPGRKVEMEEKAPAAKLNPAMMALAERNKELLAQAATANAHLVRLINYMLNMREDYPDLQWPDLPDIYDKKIWQAAS